MLAVDFYIEERGKKSPKWKVDSDFSGEVTLSELLEFTKRNLIIISDAALKEEQAKGFDKTPIVAVDGKVGKPIINVSPLGQISFTARVEAGGLLRELYSQVIRTSPVRTGFYRDNHILSYNGVEVARNEAQLAGWLKINESKITDGDIIRIVNITPYATFLELEGISAGKGTTSRKYRKLGQSRDRQERPLKRTGDAMVRMANGAYFLASRAIKRKFKFNSKIFFEFINGSNLTPSGGFPTRDYQGKKLRARFTGTKRNHSGSVSKGPYVYPSIRIVIQGGGVK
jgi:hypothetical protein